MHEDKFDYWFDRITEIIGAVAIVVFFIGIISAFATITPPQRSAEAELFEAEVEATAK